MKSIRIRNADRFIALVLLALMICGRPDDVLTQTVDIDLTATANFNADEPVTPETAIEISTSRALRQGETIAVMIGQTDVTDLFTRAQNSFSYNAKLLPLPAGKSEVAIYLVPQNGNWNEIVRLTLLVKTPDDPAADKKKPDDATAKPAGTTPGETNGKEPPPAAKPDEIKPDDAAVKTDAKADESKTGEPKPDEPKSDAAKSDTLAAETPAPEATRFFKFIPSFTLAISSQPFQGNFPLDTRPATRATFTDFDVTGSIKTESKAGIFSTDSSFDLAGSSFKEKTLQFGTLGNDAPNIDLSSYLTNVQIGKAKFSLGHTSFGGNRHLVNSFSSRGLSFNIPIGKRFDVSGGILNGTSIVGIRNFFGMSNIQHQMQGATLGIEFFPKRPNAMRLEITGFNGYLQGISNVSEGSIVDAEQSRGGGLRFVTSDRSERFKLEIGFARSRFFNPQDTSLDPDGNAIPLAPVSRSSHYGETSYQILKDAKVTKTKNLNLNVGFRYEYVEPLYRSLGASASADKFSKDVTLDASIGEITFQAGHSRSNDNLNDVPSILKSLIRSNKLAVSVPLAALIGRGEKPSPFLPRLGYSIDRTHNFGARIPVNGGFEIDPATVPDLLNTNQTFSAGWQFTKFTFDYTYNRSFADNRPATAAGSDQLGWVHNTTVGINPLEILSFTLGFSFDSQRNFELDAVNQTKSMNFGFNWKPFKNATFAVEASQALAGDLARTSRNRNINYSGQFAYSFSREKSRFKKIGMQAFARFADAYVRNRDFTVDSNSLTRTKILTAGLTINIF